MSQFRKSRTRKKKRVGDSKIDNRILRKDLQEIDRKSLIEATNAAYAKLRHNRTAWSEELEERAPWDSTLNDGLDEY